RSNTHANSRLRERSFFLRKLQRQFLGGARCESQRNAFIQRPDTPSPSRQGYHHSRAQQTHRHRCANTGPPRTGQHFPVTALSLQPRRPVLKLIDTLHVDEVIAVFPQASLLKGSSKVEALLARKGRTSGKVYDRRHVVLKPHSGPPNVASSVLRFRLRPWIVLYKVQSAMFNEGHYGDISIIRGSALFSSLSCSSTCFASS